MKPPVISLSLILIVVFQLLLPSKSFAIQAHGGAEGIIAHQIGHLFFMFSMCTFVYWSRNSRFLKNSGWRYIKYFAILLVLWNLDVVLLHFLDEQIAIVSFQKLNKWNVIVTSVNKSSMFELFYFLGKLDHLICVPALFCLYIGLKKILSDPESPTFDKPKKTHSRKV